MKYIWIIGLLIILNIDFSSAEFELCGGMDILGENDTLPKDMPLILFNKTKEVSPGYFFLSTSPGTDKENEYANYNIILDKDGKVTAYKRIGKDANGLPVDFKQAINGLLTYTEITPDKATIFIVDTSLTIKDSLLTQKTIWNFPFIKILPNGHSIMVKHEQMYMDLSDEFENGDPNTLMITSDIYEIDKDKNIVFYWRALDYIKPEDSYSKVNFQYNPSILNFIRTTGLEIDKDGSILACHSNLSEISKIDRLTGDIVWRLGGMNNEFEFLDENENNAPNYFSYQTDVNLLANGNITLFDNGFQHTEQESRAVEYEIDEELRTCKLVWEYKNSPGIYSKYNGSVQRQGNGNTLICWGNAALDGNVALTEIDKDSNNPILEVNLPYGYRSTRVSKSSWTFNNPAARVSHEILNGNTYTFNKGAQQTCTKMKINELQEIFYPMIFINKYFYSPLNPEFEETQPPIVHPLRLLVTLRGMISVDVEARFNLSCLGITNSPEKWKVYQRDNAGSGVFKQVETKYDDKTGELVINTTNFGEFIFGIPQLETKPKETWLVVPKNNEKLNQNEPVQLSWSPHGYFTDCNLQISEDASFDKIVLDTADLKTINFVFDKIESGKTYWWRVSSDNGNTKGDWSEARQFSAVADFIDVTVPDGGEVWMADSLKKIIRWDKNVSDKVKIELLKDGMLLHVISDSVFSPTGGYAWVIPDFIPYDSTYKIRISSLKNDKLVSESSEFFTVQDPKTGIDDGKDNLFGIDLKQNTPNPFNGITTIDFTIPVSGKVILSVYNILGEKAADILDKELQKGSYKINWNASELISGQYYYRIQVGGKSLTKTMTVIE